MKIRKYNLLSVPFFAFFSKKAYRHVGNNGRGANLAYLFVLMAICCIPPAFQIRHQVSKFISDSQAHLIEQIPTLEIVDGKVQFEQTRPYFISRKDGSPMAIIDTTGSLNYIDDESVLALLTESSLIVRQGKENFKTIDLSTVQHFYIDQHLAGQWLQMAQDAVTPISYGLLLTLSYVAAVVIALLAAILGVVLSSIFRSSVRFSSALRIATMAATPSIIIMTVLAAMNYTPSPLIHLVVTTLYLFVGISACSTSSVEDEEQIDLKAYLHEDESLENAA